MPRAGWKWPASRSAADDGDSGVADWVLGQQRIRINGATLVWKMPGAGAAADPRRRQFRARQQRPSPPFGLTALPAALASRIDVRGDLTGDDPAALDDWKGKLYTELDYVDLAGWQRWVDYPGSCRAGRARCGCGCRSRKAGCST